MDDGNSWIGIVLFAASVILFAVMYGFGAAVQALNEGFPTIFTSGSIMTVAGFLVGLKSSDPTIASLGICLGRGTLISIILVMLVLPQIMVVCDKLVDKGAFERSNKDKTPQADENGIVFRDEPWFCDERNQLF